MKISKHAIKGLFLFSVFSFFHSCSDYKPPTEKGEFSVTVHLLADPDNLNPGITSDANAGYIIKNMFQCLMEIDYKTLQLTPVLAESRPVLEKTPDGGLNITYTIRPEARWDNGTPVTGHDVDFTLKAFKNPLVLNQNIKPSIEFIRDVKVDPSDPKKVTIVCDTVYFLAESNSGGIPILPEYFYDPSGLMKKFTVAQIFGGDSTLKNDPDLVAFANDFNSEKRKRDKNSILGSGPYKLEEWTTDTRIVLVKKKNYWGDTLSEKVPYLEGNPSKIIFNTINDPSTALTALKAGNLDVMASVRPKDFVDLQSNEKAKKDFNLHTPMMLAYLYIGMNNADPRLDKKTRQALSHLADVDRMIKTVYYGMAERTAGPVHPSNKTAYNSSLKPYSFDPERAKKLLKEAGWGDSDGDGTLDRIINGRKSDLKLVFRINTGNEMRKSIAQMYMNDAEKAGVKIIIDQQDWNKYQEMLRQHDFDLFFGGWVTTPVGNDMKQLYHSTSTVNGGDNYINFRNAEVDKILEEIQVELDPAKAAEKLKRMQVVFHEEAPMIFLFAPTERVAISKKYSSADPSVMRPGYNVSSFTFLQTQ